MQSEDLVEIDYCYLGKEKAPERVISRNVFQTYKTRMLRKEHAKKLAAFREENPTHGFYFFDDLAMNQYMEVYWKDRLIYKIFKNSVFGASKADIWRYCILYHLGGIYLDFDSSVQFPLESIDSRIDEIVSYERNTLSSIISPEYTPDYTYFLGQNMGKHGLMHHEHTILQWLMIFKKEHPILGLTIQNIEANANFFLEREFTSVHQAVCNYSGPVIFTKSIWEYAKAGSLVNQSGFDFGDRATFKDPSFASTYFFSTDNYAKHVNCKVLVDQL